MIGASRFVLAENTQCAVPEAFRFRATVSTVPTIPTGLNYTFEYVQVSAAPTFHISGAHTTRTCNNTQWEGAWNCRCLGARPAYMADNLKTTGMVCVSEFVGRHR